MIKKILYLLLTVCCFTACQEEELQVVSFGKDLLTVGVEAQTLTVEVTANCPWYISTDSERAYAASTYGEGNAFVEIVLYKNSTFDPLQHIFTLTSEDGKSKAELVVVQEARIKMEITSEGEVPAQGGNYMIHMTTNDIVQCTEQPDWVTYVTSRALTDKTWIVECQANKTGKPRQAAMIFTGKKDEYVVNLRQDSYTPESVQLNIPTELVEGLVTYRYPIDVSPAYSDWSKLDISISNGGKAWIQDGSINIEFPAYGTYQMTIYSKEKLLLKHQFNVHSIDPILNLQDGQTVCLGEFIGLTDENCHLYFSNKNLVQQQNDGTYRFIREGTLTVTAENKYSGLKKSVTILVKRIILQLESYRITASGDKNLVSLVFSAKGCDFKEYEFYLVDRRNYTGMIEHMTGKVSGAGMQIAYYSPAAKMLEATVSDPVAALLSRYTLHFIGYINGEKHHVFQNF